MSEETLYPDTFREWMEEQFGEDFDDTCDDIAHHGCVEGYPGLTYYKDTCALYDEYESEIWSALNEDADEVGVDNAPAFIGTFSGAENVGSGDQLKNLLVWYYAERIANEVINS